MATYRQIKPSWASEGRVPPKNTVATQSVFGGRVPAPAQMPVQAATAAPVQAATAAPVQAATAAPVQAAEAPVQTQTGSAALLQQIITSLTTQVDTLLELYGYTEEASFCTD